ncbi:type VI secretion system baseplate subunit TssG [Paraburkholderia sp. J94]|uniref:type VI secretion system baseplate subunit TssG n=1 Tax=Paraburkholderia sp. J94 TaxID=2805441 RepID=UPI002AB23F67|nr:type VI secretion system baseplate subunit TssG [Paraburkholderia sp. J94]
MKRALFKARVQDLALSPSLLGHLQAEPWRYGFLALMRRIGANPAIDPLGTARLPQAEPFRIGQQPALVFAPREIASAGVAHDRLKIRLFGLGMLGPNGPLPIHITEIAREREEHRRDPTLSNFLDVFHHRHLTQFHRAWASAQSAAGLDRPDNERFTFYVAGLAGHDVGEIDEGPLPAHARLSASPHLIRESRNPGGLAATIAHYFGVPVHIEEYVFHWLELAHGERSRLGVPGAGSIMAVNGILGDKIPDRQCRFRMVIGPVDIDDYQRFTPRGSDLLRLVEWVRAFVGTEMHWELELKIRPHSAPPAVMGGPQQLGWSGWLGQSPSAEPVTGMLFEPERYVSQLRRDAKSRAAWSNQQVEQ